MPKGRKPLPQAVKDARAKPAVDDRFPEAPSWLSDDARVEWDRVAPILSDWGALNRLDLAALASYCQTYAQYVDCQERLESDGLTTADGKLHPLARFSDSLLRQLRSLIAELGFTPSSRGRLEIPPEAVKDELAEFMG